jgi:GDPmannose 4,6-dehydratase|tara:strand:- start:2518 stop:3567 length:1050 start_codon:yes stop_codon:yes gene_type:complete
MKKIALITGITGQDGSYLAEFLLKKNYVVHGIKRKSSSFNTSRIDDIYIDPHKKSNFFLYYGDLTDANSLNYIVNKVKPDEVYNLAAQSHVGVSFENPEYTAQVTGLGTLRLLETVRILSSKKKVKFYQASTSELFGEKLNYSAFNEKSIMTPKSPYGAAKLYSHNITQMYRESYNLFACSGILFNHESPRRGETFVTRKITMFLAKWMKSLNKKDVLYLGNIYAKRDWGHAKDYVEMQWKMLQQKKPEDFVIATGKTYTVKYFFNECCKHLKLKTKWQGKGLKEKCLVKYKNKFIPILKIDKKYFRPLDINFLKGDPSKAKKILKWRPKYDLKGLVKDMMDQELKNLD